MNNRMNMNLLLQMLSKMNKKDLEKGIEQASKILQSENKEDLLNQLNKTNFDHPTSGKGN